MLVEMKDFFKKNFILFEHPALQGDVHNEYLLQEDFKL
jgi:hypothetical protein